MVTLLFSFFRMTWKSHKLITFAVVWAFTHNFFYSIIASLGSIIPDILEGKIFLFDFQKWKRLHRTYSHWFIPYVIIFIVSFFSINEKTFYLMKNDFLFFPNKESSLNAFIFSALSLGCLMHILEDAISGKVPLLHPKRKTFGIKLIRTRSLLEYLFAFSVALLIFVFKYFITS